jgi:methionine-rich copper-binding protein CopC
VSLTAAPSAYAHAEPAHVHPGDGAVLNAPPHIIEVEFSQDVARRGEESRLELLDESGEIVSTEPSLVDDADRRIITLAVPVDLPPGRYEIAWYTLSAEDGDSAEGRLSFTIDPNATPAPGRESLREQPPGEQPQAPTPAVEAPDEGLSSLAVAAIVGVSGFLATEFGVVYWARSRRRA